MTSTVAAVDRQDSHSFRGAVETHQGSLLQMGLTPAQQRNDSLAQ